MCPHTSMLRSLLPSLSVSAYYCAICVGFRSIREHTSAHTRALYVSGLGAYVSILVLHMCADTSAIYAHCRRGERPRADAMCRQTTATYVSAYYCSICVGVLVLHMCADTSGIYAQCRRGDRDRPSTRMLTYAPLELCARRLRGQQASQQVPQLQHAHVCSRMLAYADVCSLLALLVQQYE